VNAVLFRPLPFRDPGKLVDMWRTNLERGIPQEEMSNPDFLDVRSQSNVFDGMAAYREGHNVVSLGTSEPERVRGVIASTNLMDLLGASPAMGRTFRSDEDEPGKGNVAILSYEFWQTRFHSGSDVVGRQMVVDGASYAVVGVMPKGFLFPISAEPAEMWLTTAADGEMAKERGLSMYNVIGRMKKGVSVAQATVEMSGIYERIAKQYPNVHTPGWHLQAAFALSDLVRDSRDALLVLFATVGMVLLIACVNVANLILARGANRRREMALRTALGASRLRVVRQLLAESMVLAVLGGGLGIFMGYLAIQVLIRVGPRDIPRLTSVSIDGQVLVFALCVSMLTSLLFGLVPALRVSNLELGDALKERGEGGSAKTGKSRFRDGLIVAEVALSLLTVLGAGLLMETLWHLERTNPGFDPNHMLTFSVEMPDAFSDARRVQFLRAMLGRLRTLPGVDSASAVYPLPFLSGSGITTRFELEGSGHDENQWLRADIAAVDEEYFRAMRIRLVKGQDFAEAKAGPDHAVAIINEEFARRYFANENPIGRRLKPDVDTFHTAAQMAEIIGIVGDIKTHSLRAEASPLVYIPVTQLPINAMRVVVRSNDEAGQLMAAVREEVKTLDAGVLVFSGQTLEQEIGITLGQPRFNALLLGVFAGLALVLTVVGLYGAISYAVSQRTREIGIRMALGAAPSLVAKLVLGSGLRLALFGTVLGLAAAAGLARLMKTLLFGVSATDPFTFAAVAIVLMIVAAAACYMPARRAMRVDPMVALRHE
ncbi:MAG: ABC transporter permease, partial [Candidatus Acidiferrum sp.]